MQDEAGKPERPSTKARLSEATGQAILLGAIAWALFALVQARWYMPAFNVHPYGVKWLAVTFLTGALPPLLVLFLAFLVSWLIGALRGRADPWRSYRDGLIVACVFTVLINVGIWFGQPN
jgi:hypothetical protein